MNPLTVPLSPDIMPPMRSRARLLRSLEAAVQSTTGFATVPFTGNTSAYPGSVFNPAQIDNWDQSLSQDP